eukprot:CAMPEP_0202403776 /NCGR_PEP_ID=MMETSP1128-20130828/5198_1 /ASSEMBLY_ACC=CAM_ASM_000463 /TAXON_ID=3047 /ORGANISM="Dunaliella tertiolecta, Strain CCMP1320" /LENGTH=56 /DNA_ID=CAMNT_0049008109 /DNA_START=53 /DNA_END=219 /DNA_ORIENTATION=-
MQHGALTAALCSCSLAAAAGAAGSRSGGAVRRGCAGSGRGGEWAWAAARVLEVAAL